MDLAQSRLRKGVLLENTGARTSLAHFGAALNLLR